MANAVTPVASTPALKPVAVVAPLSANIIMVQAELAQDKSLKVSVLASAPASCDAMTLDIDGKHKTLTGVKFPLVEYVVPAGDSIYPASKGAHTLTAAGASPLCKGSASTKFSNVESTPKITGLTIANAEVVDGQPLELTVEGSGGACNYHLSIINTETQQEWKSPRTSKFPAFDKIAFDVPSPNYPHGNYKITAVAATNDSGTEKSCQGGSNTLAFKKSRLAIKLSADTPTIKEVQIQQGKKMGGSDRFRNDELLNFAVFGNVENSDASSYKKRCQWTAKLVDSKGAAKFVGNDFSFNVYRPYGAALTSYATGSYNLQISPTPVTDPTDTKPCMGSATKKIEIFAAPGMINGVDLASRGENLFTKETGLLFMSPRISGPQCMYTVTRKVDGKNTLTTQHVHMPDGDFKDFGGQMVGEAYPNDETNVEVTVQGFGAPGLACDGVAKRSITVFDKPGKPGVVH